MAYFLVDSSRFPIIEIEAAGQIREDQVARGFAELESLFADGERFSVIVNLASATVPSLKVRGLLREFAVKHQKVSNDLTVTCSLVIHNPVVTMAVKAVYSFVKTDYAKRVFQTHQQGLVWTQRKLTDAGVRFEATRTS